MTTERVDLGALENRLRIGESCEAPAAIPTSDLRAIITEIRAQRESARWRPVIDGANELSVEEGKRYLFAIQVSTNNAPYEWEFFEDSIVWDAETPPDFRGDPGWGVSEDGLYFRELPAPPETPTAATLTDLQCLGQHD